MPFGNEPARKPAAIANDVMYAIALEILLVCPIRRSNLINIRLGKELELDPRTGLATFIVFPSDDVKNRVPIEWPVPPETAKMIDRYVRNHRPRLTGATNRYLFPAEGGGHRNTSAFADTLSKRVTEAIGAEFHLHLVRHFSVWNYLKSHPGGYGVIQLVLGHRRTATAQTFYAGLERAATAQHFDRAFFSDRRSTRLLAAASFDGRAGKPAGLGR